MALEIDGMQIDLQTGVTGRGDLPWCRYLYALSLAAGG